MSAEILVLSLNYLPLLEVERACPLDIACRLVGTGGIEPQTPTLSRWCSPTELRA